MRVMAVLAGAVLTSLLTIAAFADDDPFLWLEDAAGGRAVQWARTQSNFTLKALKSDDDYGDTFATAQSILTAQDRIPYGNLAGGHVYNFWQDNQHARGLWRRTTLAEYRGSDPRWEILLDLDALSAAQNENWVWKGAQCLPPANARCLLMLSRGGGDAIVVREFDVRTKTFVKGGFEVPEAKTDVAWVDANSIMVGTNWGQGTLTRSGYPRVVKVLARGEALGDAHTLFEGQARDVAVTGIVDFESDGRAERFISRGIDFFSTEFFYVAPDWRVMRVPVPSFAEFKGMHKRQLLFTLTKTWQSGGQIYLPGSLIAFSLDDFVATGGALPFIRLLFTPGDKNAIDAVVTSRDAVYVSYLENVKGRIRALTFDGSDWQPRNIPLPDDGAIEIAAASDFDADVMFKYASFLVPDQLYLLARGDLDLIKQLPPRFDAYGFEVHQYEAASSDGAKIPYFVVRKEDTLNNGESPTLLYAYGGFQISTTPWYWSTAGKLWLEKGGTYVIANVRGGGEFGPRWHEAAKAEYHQRNFDDLAAVARNLVTRGITSPRRLGMIGGSQGGLLVTGTFVQHPELFNAVSAQVPLTDMLRYTYMSAGASWIAEYGDPANPRQRAIIARWSPYQNVKQGVRYPRAFFLAASKDDRVHPGHARKMAARMQSYGQPVYYYEPQSGHETANTLRDRAEQIALVYTYFKKQLMD